MTTAELAAKAKREAREHCDALYAEMERLIDSIAPQPAPERICVACNGCGWCEGSPAFTCPSCKGTGVDQAR